TPAHPPAGHLEPAQCPSRPPCSPSIRLGISKDHEVAASVHADTPNPGEPVTTEQQPIHHSRGREPGKTIGCTLPGSGRWARNSGRATDLPWRTRPMGAKSSASSG